MYGFLAHGVCLPVLADDDSSFFFTKGFEHVCPKNTEVLFSPASAE